jgi:hypothetical protein
MRLLVNIAVLVALPIAAVAQEAAHGVEVLLPPRPSAQRQHPSEVAPSREGTNSRAPRVIVTAAPPSVSGWKRLPVVEVVGLDHGEIVVYSSVPDSMPAWRKLQGVDIRYHAIAEAGEASRIRTHSGQPDTPTPIPYHDWSSADPARIPYARTGGALVAQSWNAFGARFRASRIRYHGWPRS